MISVSSANMKKRVPTVIDTSSLINNRPTCPSVWYQERNTILALPLQDMSITAQFHVSTAMVHLSSTWVNTSGRTLDVLFSVPLKGTVTLARTQIGDQRFLETAVVGKNEMDQLKVKTTSSTTIPQTSPYEDYIPDLFRLPIMKIKNGDRIIIEIDFMEPLDFIDSRYVFNLALSFPSGILPPDRPIHEVVRINAVINTIVPNVQVYSRSHPLQVTPYENPSRLEVIADSPAGNIPADLNLSYCLLSPQVMGTLIREPMVHTSDGKEQGSFALFVTPPTIDEVRQYFTRTVVFIIDRSGSMTGTPFQEAIHGLESALETLRSTDLFNVVMFDHSFITWSKEPVHAFPEKIDECINWVCQHGPTGGATEIMAPLQWSLKHLGQYAQKSGTPSMPFIFILTDGAVANERQICHYVRSAGGPVRIMTFGIGSLCNWFFLKMLAEIGRGFSATALYEEQIEKNVHHLMDCCATPVLTNITVAMPGVESCELYPFPIPDLFVGAPLLIAGKYVAVGSFPSRVTLQGNASNGRVIAIDIETTSNPHIPVNKVFLKQRIDLLTSRAWLEESKELEAEATRLSCEESLPCTYTSMIAYEISPAERKKRDEIAKQEAESRDKWADETTNKKLSSQEMKKSEDERNAILKKKHNMKTAGVVAGVALGGVLVLGTVAFAAGDLGATLGNLAGIGGDMGLGHFASSIGHCNCCGCMDALHHVGCGCCGDCISSIGHLCGVCGSCCGELCHLCGQFGGCLCHVLECLLHLCA